MFQCSVRSAHSMMRNQSIEKLYRFPLIRRFNNPIAKEDIKITNPAHIGVSLAKLLELPCLYPKVLHLPLCRFRAPMVPSIAFSQENHSRANSVAPTLSRLRN